VTARATAAVSSALPLSTTTSRDRHGWASRKEIVFRNDATSRVASLKAGMMISRSVTGRDESPIKSMGRLLVALEEQMAKRYVSPVGPSIGEP
jgi:hypothetical protein